MDKTNKVKLDFSLKTDSVKVNSLSHDGRGIATIDSKTTFISRALPEEIVHYKITHKASHYNEAEAIDILNASSLRVTPPCEHFNICGGCSLQHMEPSTQIQLKEQTVLDQLNHFGRISPETLLPPLSAHTIGYRHKARLGVKFVIKKNKVLVGFREKSSHYLADINRCVVLNPIVGERITVLSDLITTLQQYQSIPQIEVAIGDEEAALVFRHLKPLAQDDLEKLIAFGKQYHFHIYLQPNPKEPVHKLWPDDKYDRIRYSLPDYQLELLFHPLDFTQINLAMNRLMVKQAITLLDLHSHETVLDLFCGIGNFTLPIARFANHVTGIEGSNEMVARAKANALHNDIHNTHFFASDLQKFSLQTPWMKAQYDKILLDPPRVGAKEILPFIPQFAAKRIVYVSCNPATLARDGGELVHQYGYQLKKIGIMNMFPHTSHIEAMAVFDKNI